MQLRMAKEKDIGTVIWYRMRPNLSQGRDQETLRIPRYITRRTMYQIIDEMFPDRSTKWFLLYTTPDLGSDELAQIRQAREQGKTLVDHMSPDMMEKRVDLIQLRYKESEPYPSELDIRKIPGAETTDPQMSFYRVDMRTSDKTLDQAVDTLSRILIDGRPDINILSSEKPPQLNGYGENRKLG